MGLIISKRVEKTLTSTPAFTSACSSAYSHSLSLSQHAFPSLLPYQLLPASLHLHASLTRSPTLPLLSRWAPPPPAQSHVDRALARTKLAGRGLDGPTFERFAVELFKGLILGEVSRRVWLRRVPVGAAGIAGVGVAVGGGAQVIGRAIGVYSLGVAASVYLSVS